MASSLPFFQYQRLDKPDQEIRLIHLQPNKKRRAELVCEIRTVLLRDEPVYEAVSYAWGDPFKRCQTVINASRLPITTNLDSALRHLRHKKRELVLWIDAICIDQSNDVEKSFQVFLMGKIYQQAARVLIWLGEEKDESKRAMALLAKASRNENLRLAQRERKSLTTLRALRRGHFNKEVVGFPLWWSLAAFLERPWWSRLWVCQELLLCRHAVFICGMQTFPCLQLMQGILNARMAAELEEGISSTRGQSRNTLTLQFLEYAKYLATEYISRNREREAPKGKDDGSMSLLEVICGLSYTHCTDARDKIFGLLALAQDNLVRLNPPDYSLECYQIFIRLVVTFIQTKQNLDILSCCQSDGKDLSWVPDWDKELIPPLIRKSITTGERLFDACGSTVASPHLDGPYPLTIQLKGFILARIHQREAVTTGIEKDWFADPTWEPPEVPVKSESTHKTRFCEVLSGQLLPSGARMSAADLSDYHRQASNEDINITFLQHDRISVSRTLSHNFQKLISRSFDRAVCTTAGGRLCFAPMLTQTEDLVCILFGGQTPFILRMTAHGNFRLIGEAYVEGVMDGEAMKDLEAGKYEERLFTLI